MRTAGDTICLNNLDINTIFQILEKIYIHNNILKKDIKKENINIILQHVLCIYMQNFNSFYTKDSSFLSRRKW